MKKTLLTGLAFGVVSCSPFSTISNQTKIGAEDDHVKVYNTNANLKSLTFGDFKFAMNQKQFRKINTAKPAFKDILFYAKTKDPAYEYYVLYNPKRKLATGGDYILKDTVLAGAHVVLAISKNAPIPDREYILSQLGSEK